MLVSEVTPLKWDNEYILQLFVIGAIYSVQCSGHVEVFLTILMVVSDYSLGEDM